MRTLFYTLIVFWSFVLCCTTYAVSKKIKQQPHHTVFIWNDDEESIPTDGTKIIIEKTINDTIYLGPTPEL